MGSRKAEERNEKIIRGLMKLPPNRRCINCNSLGPQYVCTNFWTFVCMTCSGIHREFAHRVKSVSMSKFTSQEVEALQNGGNQLARETYLKDWDLQRQRLPNNSNVDKVREFIKNVYVDRRYAGGKTSDNPPKDTQRSTSLGSVESFHSNSISLKSYSSGGLTDVISEDEQATGARLDIVSTFPQSHVPVNYGGLDLFEAPVVPEPVSSAVPPIDLIQLPETLAAPVNMFQTSQASSAPSSNTYPPAQTSSPSSLDLFQIPEQPSTATLESG